MRKTLIPIMIIVIAIIGYVAYLIYDLQSVTANGTIKAAHIQNIMVDFPAYVNRVCVKDGQLVKAGDVLLTLNIKEYGTEIRQKEQELCNAQSKLQEEQAGIYQLENDLMTAEAILKNVTQEWQDKQRLYLEGLVSLTELENAEKEVRTQRNIAANYRLSLKAKTEGTSVMDVMHDKIVSLKGDLTALRGKLSLTSITENRIVAPMTGVVAELGYHDGDVLDDEKKVLSILETDSIYLEVNVPEVLIKHIKVGAGAVFTPSFDWRKKYRGQVQEISHLVITKDNETFFPVKVRLFDRDRYLVPYLNGKVKFIKNKK